MLCHCHVLSAAVNPWKHLVQLHPNKKPYQGSKWFRNVQVLLQMTFFFLLIIYNTFAVQEIKYLLTTLEFCLSWDFCMEDIIAIIVDICVAIWAHVCSITDIFSFISRTSKLATETIFNASARVGIEPLDFERDISNPFVTTWLCLSCAIISVKFSSWFFWMLYEVSCCCILLSWSWDCNANPKF